MPREVNVDSGLSLQTRRELLKPRDFPVSKGKTIGIYRLLAAFADNHDGFPPLLDAALYRETAIEGNHYSGHERYGLFSVLITYLL